MENIAKAIVNVTKAIKGVEKSTQVGSGNYGYKGVSDYEVKKIFNKTLPENGLSMLPVSIEPKVTVSRWVEGERQKQSIFTEVVTKYLLLHTSGESITISGYGHGVDTQDKGAGKATTYALKYALLYTFLVPTGKIDDTDDSASEGQEVAQLPALNPGHEKWTPNIGWLANGGTIEKLRKVYTISPAHEKVLLELVKQHQNPAA